MYVCFGTTVYAQNTTQLPLSGYKGQPGCHCSCKAAILLEQKLMLLLLKVVLGLFLTVRPFVGQGL